ncbi:polyphenol oxidase family protein [Desulfurivibrio sp. D14AmB]|uniref:polyphenol oxidase family protein n=1 Tax=Desulfurivibrio sp. D14AmB TaxID=3374370 RepID=UPI00376EAC19
MGLEILSYQQFATMDPPLPHGSFARGGGVSVGPYDSLNLSYGVGDDPDRVGENRRRIREALGLRALVSCRQIHGTGIYVLREPLTADLEVAGYDALISPWPQIGLLIQQADCQAVMLHDPRLGVAANIHVGWRGSVAKIIARVLALMVAEFGCRPRELVAAISPSLGPCCAEFINYRRELPPEFHPYRLGADHFDFWAISREQLRQEGVPDQHIATAGICTRCNTNYFSHRRDGRCGRNGSVIAPRTSSP